jgi:hypothetical protein
MPTNGLIGAGLLAPCFESVVIPHNVSGQTVRSGRRARIAEGPITDKGILGRGQCDPPGSTPALPPLGRRVDSVLIVIIELFGAVARNT